MYIFWQYLDNVSGVAPFNCIRTLACKIKKDYWRSLNAALPGWSPDRRNFQA
jgi:hypothetical protein